MALLAILIVNGLGIMKKGMVKVDVGGKEYPCRVTMGALVWFKRESGHDVSKMSQEDVSELALFLWCCVKSASNADGVEFPLDFQTFADHLDAEDLQRFYSSMGEKKTTRKSVTP